MLNEKKLYEAPQLDVCRMVAEENISLNEVPEEEAATYGARASSGIWGPWV
jgi:hypothetical protein